MSTINRKIAAALVAAVVIAGLAVGCKSAEQKKPADAEGSHTMYHGGCANAIEKCEVGHVEALLDGDTLKCWFVGKAGETGKAVRIPATQIDLVVTLDAGQTRPLKLTACPNAITSETPGNCSHFEGQADWLKDVKSFVATGRTTFKDDDRAIRIEYPKGYDPD